MPYRLDIPRKPIIANLAFNYQHFPKPPLASRLTVLFAAPKVMCDMVTAVGAFIRERRVLIAIVMHAVHEQAAAWNV